MSNAPEFEIDLQQFWVDPYPDLERMRATAPICYVPQLDATLITRRDDVFTVEKNIEVFSSLQPDGLMTKLMGENMMRKDGEDHQKERKAIFPTVSPKTVRDVWKAQFEEHTASILDELGPHGECDLVADFAMQVSAEALKAITGLPNMHFAEMNRVSQGMIDGCANYGGDPAVEAHCNDCTASIDRHIDEMMPIVREKPNHSLLSVQMQAGLSDYQIRANIKLAISGGQNEPRDAIAGVAWALLTHPDVLEKVKAGEIDWHKAFEEYARWISPIGMSPRRIAKPAEYGGVRFETNDRAFLMFGSANRDEEHFSRPDQYDPSRNLASSIPFGAGPHFCAGAWASRALIAEVALPALFTRLDNLRIPAGAKVLFGGWAFRGPLKVPCVWG